MHLCVLHRSCWRDHRQYGMPMRLYVGDNWWWTIPFLDGRRIFDRVWEDAEPLDIERFEE